MLAKKAVERGLATKPWVKTSLAPGSTVVTQYLDEAGLTPFLDQLGFNLVGYGCTTCIGNSGPLPEPVSAAVAEGKLAVAAVLSGNRNFEARVSNEVRANYLASPPLVVAYALAGHMDVDLLTEPLGTDTEGQPVYLSDIWPSHAGGAGGHPVLDPRGDVPHAVRRCLHRRRALARHGRRAGRALPVGSGLDLRAPPTRTSTTSRASRRQS